MAAPVLVRAYTGQSSTRFNASRARIGDTEALPPISSYAFANILKAADGPDVQAAIDGIAEICAKTRLSLADEYGSHLPPLGEITAASSAAVRPHLLRPGMRRALTSVPEGSSGSSEGSKKSRKGKVGFFGLKRQHEELVEPVRKIRIGSMGRTITVGGTAVLATENAPVTAHVTAREYYENFGNAGSGPSNSPRRTSDAATSLHRLLATSQRPQTT